MDKKPSIKKLSINKLALRDLTPEDLERVAGGQDAATCSQTNYTKRDGTQSCCNSVVAPGEPTDPAKPAPVDPGTPVSPVDPGGVVIAQPAPSAG